MNEPLVFVHLSDIHFNKKWCDYYDLDKDVRDQLEKDVAELKQKLGNARGILITGDVAYAGKKEDYDVAFDWVSRLCGIAGCREQDVWCVPGNHDIDRSVVDKSLIIKQLHERLRTNPEEVDEKLTECLRDEEGAIAIFRPLENYNRFAAKFGCESQFGPLAWQHDLELNDGSCLRIFGANSTLISDKNDNNSSHRLILGTIQTTPTEKPGVTYLFMCHHPPDWLIDYDNANMNLDARARAQLFGHKHLQTIDERNGCVRIVAGAVHPSRREQKWKPRYNWLLISVRGSGDDRGLDVDIHPRAWSDARPEYVADTPVCRGNQDHRLITLKLEPWRPPRATHNALASLELTTELESNPTSSSGPSDVDTSKQGNDMDAARTLTYRFLSLSYVSMIEIAQKLELLDDSDEGLKDFQLFARVFARAAKQRKLERLWNEVETEHKDKRYSANPYVGQ